MDNRKRPRSAARGRRRGEARMVAGVLLKVMLALSALTACCGFSVASRSNVFAPGRGGRGGRSQRWAGATIPSPARAPQPPQSLKQQRSAAAAQAREAAAAAVGADVRGRGSQAGAPSSKLGDGMLARSSGKFAIERVSTDDIEEVSRLCVSVFFGSADTPWKMAQLKRLYSEQCMDLKERWGGVSSTKSNTKRGFMLKAVDRESRSDSGAPRIVGFIEVVPTRGMAYGMGEGVPRRDLRPVISNLAVDPSARRSGVGSELLRECEELTSRLGFDELVLLVEEDNTGAREFYDKMGFVSLFVDRAARRYDTSGFLLQNVRTSKITMRKELQGARSATTEGGSFLEKAWNLFFKL